MATESNAKSLDFGPVFDDDVVRVPMPGGSSEWVDVLRHITEGIEAAAQAAAKGRYTFAQNRAQKRKSGSDNGAEPGTADFHFDTGAYRLHLLASMVKAWSFKDKKGTVIPLDFETISRLPTHTRVVIMDAIDDMNPSLDEETRDDLSEGSSPSSKEKEPAQTNSEGSTSVSPSGGVGKST